jgi:tRNA (cytidine/uridine-2'-O-)-methyltransferase
MSSTSTHATPPVLAEDGSRFTWQRPDLAVVLVEPKIPQNSGNVSRSCAATKVPLHLVAPAFELDDKKLKRAGLDYWDWVGVVDGQMAGWLILILTHSRARPRTDDPQVCLQPHASVEGFLEFYASLSGEKRLIAFSKFGKSHHAAEGLYGFFATV